MDNEAAAVEALTPDALVGGLLHIDLAALKANYRQLVKVVQPAACGACIKSNAYGLGMAEVAEALWSAGCRIFFVALPAEGMALRAILPDAVIYVLDGLLPRLAATYHRHALRPALSSLDEVREWAAFSTRQGMRAKAALHLDTGLNRLGLSPAEVHRLGVERDLLEAFEITLLVSHLACADEPSHAMNWRQREAFELMRASLPDAPASLSNTPGALIGKDFIYDLVRPGIGLYGGNPYAQRPNPMRPVIHLYATLLQVRDVKAGDRVGYGATWTADRDFAHCHPCRRLWRRPAAHALLAGPRRPGPCLSRRPVHPHRRPGLDGPPGHRRHRRVPRPRPPRRPGGADRRPRHGRRHGPLGRHHSL